MSRCHCQVAGNIFSVGSPQGAASALQRPSCHIEVICSLQHRDFSAFPFWKSSPDFHFTGHLFSMQSWRRTQITRLSYKHRDFHVTLVIWEKEKRRRVDGVSQRQICAGVCHLTCRHDMKMIKQTASLRWAAVPYGSYRGHRWLEEVVERIFLGSAVGQRWDKAKWAHEAQRLQSFLFFSKAKRKTAV